MTRDTHRDPDGNVWLNPDRGAAAADPAPAPCPDCAHAAAEIARLTAERTALTVRCSGLEDRLEHLMEHYTTDLANHCCEIDRLVADAATRDETIARLFQEIQQLTNMADEPPRATRRSADEADETDA